MSSGSFVHYIDRRGHNYIKIFWKSTPQSGSNRSLVEASVKVYRRYDIHEDYSHPVNLYINGHKFTRTRHGWRGRGWTSTLVSGKTYVSHDAQGKATCKISASLDFNLSYSGVWIGHVSTGNKYIKLSKLNSKSSFTIINTGAVKIGDTLRVSLKRSGSGVRHSIIGKLGDYTFSILNKDTDNGKTTAYSHVLSPEEFLPHMKASSQVLQLTCTTYYNGKSLGSTSKTVSVSIRDTDKPVIIDTPESTQVTITPVPVPPNTESSVYIQGKTIARVVVSPTWAVGSVGGTYNVTFNGESKKALGEASATIDVGPVTQPGTNTIIVSVTDKRGQTSAEITKTFDVVPYSLPVISSPIAYRCLPDGTKDKNGTSIKISFDALQYNAQYNESRIEIFIKDRLDPDTQYNKIDTIQMTQERLSVEKIYQPYTADRSYDVKIVITDKYNSVGTSFAEVGTEELLMDCNHNSVAFGKIVERSNEDGQPGVVEFGLESFFEDNLFKEHDYILSDESLVDIVSVDAATLKPVFDKIKVSIVKDKSGIDKRMYPTILVKDVIAAFASGGVDISQYKIIETRNGQKFLNNNFINLMLLNSLMK